MLEVKPKMLRSANAGNYKHGLLGNIRDFLQSSSGFGIRGLLGSNIVVLDISFYQGSANFVTMKENGVNGVIVRAGQNLWKDTHAEIFMTGAEQVGLPIGSYWFYDSRKTPQEQALKWKEVLGNHKTPLKCWADYEENYGGSYGGWRNLYDFLEKCKEIMPDREFGIYTGYYYWLEHSPLLNYQLDYFKQYPLWEAWYVEDPSYVKIPKPWTNLLFWQKTSGGNGTLYGVGSKEVDVNLFMGTQEEADKLFGNVEIPQEGEEGMFKVWSTQYVMTLRNENSIFGARVVSIPTNTVMIADVIEPQSRGGVIGDRWAHIPEVVIGGTTYSGWVAVIHNGTIYCKTEQIVAPVLPAELYIATKADMSDKVRYVKEA